MKRAWVVCAIAALGMVGMSSQASAEEYLSGIEWERPKVVDPGPPGGPPADAVVLFDGKDMSKWNGAEKWQVQDGAMIAGEGQVTSKDVFGDCQVHIEWAAAEKVEGSGQGRSNSGVFLMGRYELQVLDSFDNETYFDGQCGAIYKQHPPLANVCRKPGEWQTYDIIWKAPRFKDGKAGQSRLHYGPAEWRCRAESLRTGRRHALSIVLRHTSCTRTRAPSACSITVIQSASATSGCAK